MIKDRNAQVQPAPRVPCPHTLCNPPYIETNTIDTLDEEVKRFEPRLALDGGGDGLRFYRFLSENIVRNLLPEGRVFLEIGYNQGVEVKELFEKANLSDVKIIKDYAELDRVVIGRKLIK